MKPIDEKPNKAVLTTCYVVVNVIHDEDGDWQFLDKEEIEEVCKIRRSVESFDLMNGIKYMMYEQNKYEGAWFASKIEIKKDKTYSMRV
ncbi:hypothetical protein FUSO6_11630 [Fusobacterium necrophorum DAB]|uniref:hypothetical protein n=1 Tax=Fusobacterium necrophorum TaxID=859 RepID=UPI0004617095|nr:hypothetical protein [Fusobacterium necrophorum]KDE66498.1 hypothetical protein FUSO6_11630 [Fusobacterium necrophorum DAB]